MSSKSNLNIYRVYFKVISKLLLFKKFWFKRKDRDTSVQFELQFSAVKIVGNI